MGTPVVFSIAVENRNRIYHKTQCIYAKQIKKANRKKVCIDSIVSSQPRFCKYCAGLAGEMRMNKKYLNEKCQHNHMQFIHDSRTDTLYVSTENGFWKIFWKEELARYLLYHRNEFPAEMDSKEAMYGDFHRQGDVSPSMTIDRLLDYICAHDLSKRIIADDYRKLPKHTQKEKKYYRIAEQKAMRKARNSQEKQLDRIFEMLEKQHGEEFRALACW